MQDDRDRPAAAGNLGLIALASAGGVAGWLACATASAGWLGWFAVWPVAVVVDRAATWRGALLLASWAGTVASFGACDWMIAVTMRFAAFPRPLAVAELVVFSVYQSLVWVIFAGIVRAGREWRRLPMALLAPIGLVVAQWVVPYLFPYGLEISQARYPYVTQIAEVTGRLGVTALLAVAGGAAFDLFAPARRGSRRGALVGAVLVALSLVYGAVRYHTLEGRRVALPAIRLGIAAPQLPSAQLEKETPVRPTAAGLARLMRLRLASAELMRGGAEIVLWPESAYPWLFPEERREDFPASDERNAAAGLARPVLFGALTTSADGRDQRNSALAILPDGRVAGRYDKQVLVPFGEYVPTLVNAGWIHRLALGDAAGLRAGPTSAPIVVARAGGPPLRLGILICYEDILTDQAARVARHRPDLLVDLSNDAWFGDAQERRMHLAASAYAAVEQRIGLVRAASPDGSAFIDAAGRIEDLAAPGSADGPDGAGPSRANVAAIAVTVPLQPMGPTIYAMLGPWFPTLALLAALGLIIARWRAGKIIARRTIRM